MTDPLARLLAVAKLERDGKEAGVVGAWGWELLRQLRFCSVVIRENQLRGLAGPGQFFSFRNRGLWALDSMAVTGPPSTTGAGNPTSPPVS